MQDISSLKGLIEKQLSAAPEKASIVALVDLIIEYAYLARASDIHLEPAAEELKVRFRIDGILHTMFEKPKVAKALQQEIISRLKVLSGLRTDEHGAPQDGRFKARMEEAGGVDIRVSIMPTYYGENAVLRLLAETQNFALEDLGFSEKDLAKVKRAIAKPYGMILANGPTGSGKTTTLYTILRKLDTPGVSIITIEDPIEYSLEGTTQMQVNAQAGLTFASGLRSILRQDPNIVMVGEIRDQETADISVNAALTGHLLLSTLHTNDSATTFPRLVDMGVPPFLVASTVNVAMGQRLVRTICQACRKARKLTDAELKSLRESFPPEVVKGLEKNSGGFFSPQGCAKCDGTGYKGRIGIREVLEVNDEVRELVMQRSSASKIKGAAVRGGMTTMLQDGLEKAAKGLTTLEEVLRVVYE